MVHALLARSVARSLPSRWRSLIWASRSTGCSTSLGQTERIIAVLPLGTLEHPTRCDQVVPTDSRETPTAFRGGTQWIATWHWNWPPPSATTGTAGVADDLATAQGLTSWLRSQSDLLDPPVSGFTADEASRAEVVAVRAAVRSLFARAVSPEPPSPADADRLLTAEDALRVLNAAAARQSVTPQLDWPVGADPRTRLLSGEPDPTVRLTATLARAAIDFLTGPQRELLRACTAPGACATSSRGTAARSTASRPAATAPASPATTSEVAR